MVVNTLSKPLKKIESGEAKVKIDLDKMNAHIKGLPQTALSLMPDDAVLIFLVGLIPSPVTQENAKQTMVIMSLVCRRVALAFNDLAAEQEALVKEWQG